MAPGRNAAGHPSRQYLHEGWEFCATLPNECTTPAALSQADSAWRSTQIPATAASSLRAANDWSLDGTERRFDADDWWYRLHFDLATDIAAADAVLGLDGLATLCEVWLNGELLLRSDNMHLAYAVRTPSLQPGRNELYLAFRSLDHALKQKRPRPRWRAPMIENQQLRWHRTTVLGRTPGWSPPAAPVGPWKPIWVERETADAIRMESLRTDILDATGSVYLRARAGSGVTLVAPQLQVYCGETLVASTAIAQADTLLEAQLNIPSVEKWWPHTHGPATRYTAVLRARSTDGKCMDLPLGHIGFRQIVIQRGKQDGFAVEINGANIFCRGACWTPLDVVSLHSDAATCRKALEQVVSAGFNMLRISGTFVYEDDIFFDLCDELGILVWQEFMFANMDYPAQDNQFLASVNTEAAQHLQRWAMHPCVAVICGNSEVSQQAAMWGASREHWSPKLFDEVLRDLTAEHCPSVPYWPSSAHDGDFPHQPQRGTTSYYGVGAYLRPLDDLRRSDVKFATECLAFANIPDAGTLEKMPGGSTLRVHHPTWKRRAPRDLGAGWDFEDVRDHYLQLLFKVDPLQLRQSDHPRYLEVSQRVPGEVMSAAFTEWRRRDSSCGGALGLFLPDLFCGAGWGIIDALGQPKAPYFALRRTLQPRWVGISDEGLNGLAIHVANELPTAMNGHLELALYRQGQYLITRSSRDLNVPARTTMEVTAGSLLGEFHDLTHAYRFGPLSCDLAIATLTDAASGASLQAFHLPYASLHASPQTGFTLSAQARTIEPGVYQLTLLSTGFARSVYVDAPGYTCDDQYFCMAPGAERTLTLRINAGNLRNLQGTVNALNCASPARIEILA